VPPTTARGLPRAAHHAPPPAVPRPPRRGESFRLSAGRQARNVRALLCGAWGWTHMFPSPLMHPSCTGWSHISSLQTVWTQYRGRGPGRRLPPSVVGRPIRRPSWRSRIPQRPCVVSPPLARTPIWVRELFPAAPPGHRDRRITWGSPLPVTDCEASGLTAPIGPFSSCRAGPELVNRRLGRKCPHPHHHALRADPGRAIVGTSPSWPTTPRPIPRPALFAP